MTAGSRLPCDHVVELVTDYLEGSLPAGDRSRLVAHLRICTGCDAYVEQVRATIRVTGALRGAELDPVLRRRLLDAFRGWRDSRPPAG